MHLPVKLIKMWDQILFRHFDLTKCFCLIANATFLCHRLNKVKHLLVIGGAKLVLSNYVLKFNSRLAIQHNPLHTFLSKLSSS